MENFILSGFSDEIDASIDVQFDHLQKLGIHYFEPRGIDGKNISDLTFAETKELKQKMDNSGIKASSIGSPIGKIKITDAFEPHLEKVKRVLEVANMLETNYIRIFSFYLPQEEKAENYRDAVMERMFKMAELAQEAGIILLHENEKGIYGDIADRCLDLLKTVESPSLRAVFDPANFIQCGQKVYPEAFDLLLPYIAYIHIKDATADGQVVPAGMGIGKIEDLLLALKKVNYHGFLSLEPHLGNFVGFSALENGEDSKKETSTPEKFTIAYQSLMKILERVNQE